MACRLILDTGVLIAAERGHIDLPDVIGDDDPAIAAITAMELLSGVHRSTSESRDVRALHVESMLAVHARRTGRPRGAFDLIIAATAAATGRTPVTGDAAAGLHDLPGLTVRTLASAEAGDQQAGE